MANLAVTVGVSRWSGISGLASFTLLFTTMLVVMNVVRTLVLEPWLTQKVFASVVRELRTLCAIGFAAYTIVVGVAISLVYPNLSDAAVIAAAASCYYWCEVARLVLFRQGRVGRAVLSDLAVLVILLATAVLELSGAAAGAVLMGWTTGLAVGLAISVGAIAGPLASVRVGLAFWRRRLRGFALPLLLDGLGTTLAAYGSLYIIALVASKTELGYIRLITTCFSPIQLVFTGVLWWLLPEFARREHRPAVVTLWKAALLLAAISTAAAVCITAASSPLTSRVFGTLSPGYLPFIMCGLASVLASFVTPWLAAARSLRLFTGIATSRLVLAILGIALVFCSLVDTAAHYFIMMAAINFALGVTAVARVVWSDIRFKRDLRAGSDAH